MDRGAARPRRLHVLVLLLGSRALGRALTGSCTHCGLAAPSGASFCCFGCELAAELAAEAGRDQRRLRGALTFCLILSMAVMMLSLFLFAEDVYDTGAGAGLGWMRTFYRVAAGVLATPVVLLLGVPLVVRAARGLGQGRLSMELLIGAGALAAYGVSVASIVLGRRGVYFDSATSALLLATLGRYLEASARARASRLLGRDLDLAREPTLAETAPGEYAAIPSSTIEAGRRLRILAEQVVPVDAVVEGRGVEVDLGVLTGEARPVLLAPGERVPAGAVPITGVLHCIALASARESTLERLAALARSLAQRSSRVERLADRFAVVLTPLVCALALAALAYWSAAVSAERGVVVALAVVLAACPCTYGVTTPLVLWLSLRRALAEGVLVRNAAVLERLAEVDVVAFDKTGTLTERRLTVDDVVLEPGVAGVEVAALVAALEADSRHPVGAALGVWAARSGATALAISEQRWEPGRGVSGRDPEGRGVSLASGDPSGARVMLVRDGQLLARFHLGETLRHDARAASRDLATLGVRAVMLTGDGAAGAAAAADALGMPAETGLDAREKVARLAALGPHVAMVGDGLNDAPALAGVPSFAVDGATGLARGVAQAALLEPELRLVPWTLALSRRAVRLARRNLVLATAYNAVFLALAAAGMLRPVWAGLAMLGASLLALVGAAGIEGFPGLSRAPFRGATPPRPAEPSEPPRGATPPRSAEPNEPPSAPAPVATETVAASA